MNISSFLSSESMEADIFFKHSLRPMNRIPYFCKNLAAVAVSAYFSVFVISTFYRLDVGSWSDSDTTYSKYVYDFLRLSTRVVLTKSLEFLLGIVSK
jgi:hypothetical protein